MENLLKECIGTDVVLPIIDIICDYARSWDDIFHRMKQNIDKPIIRIKGSYKKSHYTYMSFDFQASWNVIWNDEECCVLETETSEKEVFQLCFYYNLAHHAQSKNPYLSWDDLCAKSIGAEWFEARPSSIYCADDLLFSSLPPPPLPKLIRSSCCKVNSLELIEALKN